MDSAAMKMMLYGDKSNFIGNYITQQMQQLAPAFNEFSNRVYQNLQSSYNYVTDQLTRRGLMNQLQQQGVQVLDNYFMELTSFTQLQNANLTMQRWVMCIPEVNQLYLDQNIDGYSETFKNINGNGVGDNNYSYRLATDGLIQDTENGFMYKHHIEDLLPGDRELVHSEKVIFSHTKDAVKHILDTCKFDFSVKTQTPVKRNG
jgi:hypothetical protein